MKRKLKGIKEINKFEIYDITVANEHCFELENGVIAHNSMFPKEIVGGGTGSYYSADNIFIIGRQQEKDGTELTGHNFIINVEKSRYVKEKSKIPITVSFDGGIQKYSGLMDIALEGKFISKPSPGWYAKINRETGEILNKVRFADTQNKIFWSEILKDKEFSEFVTKKYGIAHGNILKTDELVVEPEQAHTES